MCLVSSYTEQFIGTESVAYRQSYISSATCDVMLDLINGEERSHLQSNLLYGGSPELMMLV